MDVVALGLYHKNRETREHLLESGFDGVATYFAPTGYTEGARPSDWNAIGAWAHSNGLLFAPAVAPGHNDLKMHPWNKLWRRERGEHGEYYAAMWAAAVGGQADAVLINSYNGWLSGTQIEPVAQDKSGYAVHTPGDAYLTATSRHAATFAKALAERTKSKDEL